MSTLRNRATPAEFAKLSGEFLSLIEELKAIKDTEFARLEQVSYQIWNDNMTMRTHISNSYAPITLPAWLILKKPLTKSFVTPMLTILEYLLPRLADFQITYEDAFGKEEMFSKVMEGFDVCKNVDAAFLKSVEEVMLQVKENKELRFRLLARTSPVQRVELLKANDDWPSPADFVCRAPLRVSSDRVALVRNIDHDSAFI
ncbi:uncharacterized protein J3D65DRAFT_666248 [Phyllosticta citribraziliensis]|uniref:Uncharacterized protein n=1 Tax=Phyllosticta citribraziliensis TaxID=989973 RepID=A0ABR1LZQ0_9PEZI